MTAAAALDAGRFPVPGRGELRPLVPADSRELCALIEANHAELARWLAWAQDPSDSATLARIERMRAAELQGAALNRVIALAGRIVGEVSLPRIDRPNNRTDIGYWLDRDHQGHGLVTAGVAVLAHHAFTSLKLRRAEIHTDVSNVPSRAVAERLGFRFEGILRQAYRITDDRYSDDAVYAMIASDPERLAMERAHGLAPAGR